MKKLHIIILALSFFNIGFSQLKKQYPQLGVEENKTISTLFTTTTEAKEFVNQMDKEDGVAKLEKTSLIEGTYVLEKISNKLELSKVDFHDDAKVDFSSKNEIEVSGSLLMPNDSGEITLMVEDFKKEGLPNETINSKQVIDEMAKTKIYPNPVVDVVSIKLGNYFKNKAIVSVYDLSGKLLLTKEIGKETEQLNWARYSAGKYIIKIYSNSLEEVFSVLKQ